MITREGISLNDLYLSVSNFLTEYDEGFTIASGGVRSIISNNRMQNTITYEVSMKKIEYTRSIYGMLDYLADIGGLFAALGPLCKVFITIFQYRGSYM